MPEDMPAERIYDPDLGRERNALPGEIVKPEEEKTLQRMMREGREYFQEVYAKVKENNKLTKEYTEDELEIALRLGETFAQVKRGEYLEAIRANPVNIIRETLLSISDEKTERSITKSLKDLQTNAQEIANEIQARKAADKQMGKPTRLTSEYANDIITRNSKNFKFLFSIQPGNDITGLLRSKANTLLEKLEVVPRASQTSFKELALSIGASNRDPQKPVATYSYDSYQVFNLPLLKPGLEGILINFRGESYLYELSFYANEKGIAKIAEAEEKVQPQSAK